MDSRLWRHLEQFSLKASASLNTEMWRKSSFNDFAVEVEAEVKVKAAAAAAAAAAEAAIV